MDNRRTRFVPPRGKNNGIVYKFCSVWWSLMKWLPVILVAAIMTWSYYAYVVELCLLTVKDDVARVLMLTFYHVFLVMLFWSYWQTILTNVRPVPEEFKLPSHELEKLLASQSEEEQRSILDNFAVHLPVLTRTPSGCIRYCNRCAQIKPDRSHHCSVCNACVLKMDHHCPWVNNCVHYHNYKFFVLFLMYALMYCFYIVATDFVYFIDFWKNPAIDTSMSRYHVIFVFIVSIMFGMTLASLFGYHTYLTFRNRTTLESFRAPVFRSGPDKNGFSLGAFNNFKQVFGSDPKLWLLPIFTSMGDGVEYPCRAAVIEAMANGNGASRTYRSVEDVERQAWQPQGAIEQSSVSKPSSPRVVKHEEKEKAPPKPKRTDTNLNLKKISKCTKWRLAEQWKRKSPNSLNKD